MEQNKIDNLKEQAKSINEIVGDFEEQIYYLERDIERAFPWIEDVHIDYNTFDGYLTINARINMRPVIEDVPLKDFLANPEFYKQFV